MPKRDGDRQRHQRRHEADDQRRAHALQHLVEDVLPDLVGAENVVIDAQRQASGAAEQRAARRGSSAPRSRRVSVSPRQSRRTCLAKTAAPDRRRASSQRAPTPPNRRGSGPARAHFGDQRAFSSTSSSRRASSVAKMRAAEDLSRGKSRTGVHHAAGSRLHLDQTPWHRPASPAAPNRFSRLRVRTGVGQCVERRQAPRSE